MQLEFPVILAAVGMAAGKGEGREDSRRECQSIKEEKTSQGGKEVSVLHMRHLPQHLQAIQQTLPPQPAGTWGLSCWERARAAKAGMEGSLPEGHCTHAMCQPPIEPCMVSGSLGLGHVPTPALQPKS